MQWVHRLLGTADRDPPARRQAVALQALHFFNDGYQAAFLLLLAVRATSLSLTPFQIGVITALHFLMGVVVSTQCGRLVRCWSSLPVLLAGMVLYGVCFTLSGFTGRFWLLVVIYLIAGVGYGVFHPVAFAFVARLASPGRTARAMGTFTAVGDIGRVVFSFAVLTVSTGRDPVVVLQLTGLIACALAAITTCATPMSSAATAPCVAPSAALKRAPGSGSLFRRNPGLMRVCALGFLDSVASSVLYVFLPVVLLEKGCGDATILACITTFFAASLAGKVAVGWAADYLGMVKTFVVFEVVNALSIVALLFVSGHTALVVVAVCLGVAAKGTLPVILSLTATELRKEDLSKGFGVNQAILGIATTISPLLLGWISSLFGACTSFGVAASICVLAAAFGSLSKPRPTVN